MKDDLVNDSQGLVKDLVNDCISRQAAISHVDDVPYIKEHPNVGLLWKAWIESLPSAQPERKKGRWIDNCSCSNCNWINENDEGYALYTTYDFCPNCGARMDGDDNG